MTHGIPEVLSKVISDFFHVLKEAEASRMLGCVFCGIIFNPFVGKVEFLSHCCYKFTDDLSS